MMMSPPDAQFLKDMIANREAGMAVAKKYLQASPADRRAQVTSMANGVVTGHAADIAKMTDMMKNG